MYLTCKKMGLGVIRVECCKISEVSSDCHKCSKNSHFLLNLDFLSLHAPSVVTLLPNIIIYLFISNSYAVKCMQTHE